MGAYIRRLKFNRRGQIALPFVLLVGGIIIEIAIAVSLISFFSSASTLGERLSFRALSAANTGVYDAISRISHNKEYAATGENYTITVGNDSVSVTVSRISDDANNIYEYTIESVATAESRQRKLAATVTVNQTSGLMSLKSMQEQSLE